jgi:hypothetical protein
MSRPYSSLFNHPDYMRYRLRSCSVCIFTYDIIFPSDSILFGILWLAGCLQWRLVLWPTLGWSTTLCRPSAILCYCPWQQ